MFNFLTERGALPAREGLQSGAEVTKLCSRNACVRGLAGWKICCGAPSS
ncbi:hypothetical protein M8494_23435 [Serratia ureilytica]